MTAVRKVSLWRRAGGCLVMLVCVPLAYYLVQALLRSAPLMSLQAIAHRGGLAYRPENTLAAFQNAIDQGVDWLEFDVQMTKDGALVVIHDETVDRTTNGSGRVADMTLEQIRALDAGQGERVPTFEEAIAVAKESGTGFFPEAKEYQLYPGIEDQMVAALRQAGYLQNSAIQSFGHAGLEAIQAQNPDVKVCPLYGLWQLNLSNPQPEKAQILCPMAEMVVLNPWMIRQAHAQDKQVFIWFGVVENPLMMRLLLAMGADGLIVNDPAVLLKILGR
jgi:glycerophosphoryl diester phosphodiesterase